MSFNLGIKLVSRKWRSTREAASCCQPVRHPPGSSNGGGGGRAPAARAGQMVVQTPSRPQEVSSTAVLRGSHLRPWPCTVRSSVRSIRSVG